MAKRKVVFVCQECGYESPKWLGKCSGCGAWNSLVEEFVKLEPAAKHLGITIGEVKSPTSITNIDIMDSPRFHTGSKELDRVLGNGVVPGSMTLVVGDPGVGKSSLTLTISAYVAKQYGKVLYVSGEESAHQIKLRAERLNSIAQELYILSETNLETIEEHALKLLPNLIIVDSIQTIYRPDIPSAPGSVGQIRECAAQLMRLAKNSSITTFVVGHVTKDGVLAGPRVLEHIVDTVLYFEGDRNSQFRVLRAVKNRFGSTNEIGLFEMRSEGLLDVPDASKFFLSERPLDVPGSVVVPAIEGTRPLLVEVQALVSSSPFMPSRRTSDYVDIKRIQLLLAVLEKRIGMLLGTSDVYVKVAGGIKVDEPAVDLGLALAIASSFRNHVTSKNTVVFGEVGLAGEIRAVTQAEARIREAERLGFKRVILPVGNIKNLSERFSIELIGVETLLEGLEAAFE